MPDFMCVQCFQCETFQVQQVKKVDKFTCRLCQAPQSVRKMYAISTKAKDIRLVVVDLNAKRADIDTALTKPHAKPQPASSTQHQHSQWTSFVTEESALPDCNYQDEPDECPEGFITSMPDKVQRKRKLPNELEHCGLNRAGSKKPVGAAGLQYHHTAQPKHGMRGPSCTSSPVSTQQHEAASRSPKNVQYGVPGKAESPVCLQPASLSVAHGYGYQASLPQAATHKSLLSREPQPDMQASESTSIGRRAIWSCFLECDDDAPRFGDQDASSNDGDSNDLVTAFD